MKISERQFVREDCLVRVSVCPFQFNPSTGELRASRRMRISVRFESPLPKLDSPSRTTGFSPGGEGGEREDVFSQILNRTVLNYAKREWADVAQALEGTASLEAGEASRASGQVLPMSGLSGKSLRMEVKQEGIYRITYEDLAANKLNPASIAPDSLRVLNGGAEIAIKVVSALEDRLGPGDTIEFFARGLDNTYTDTNVYWLTLGEGPGRRIESTDGSLTGQGEKTTAFTDMPRFEENRAIWPYVPGAPERDHWFWEKLTAPVTKTYTIQVSSVVVPVSNAVLRVALRGATTMAPHPNHHTRVLLNGVQIGDATWDDDIQYIHRMSLPEGLLKEGENTVSIAVPGDTGAPVDSVLLNWIEVRYSRLLEAESNRLFYHVTGEGRLEMAIRKLGLAEVRIFDITDPADPREVVGASVEPDGELYTAAFEGSVEGGKNYCVLTGDGVRSPDLLSAWEPADLANPQNGADYLLITSKTFLSSVAPLMKYHEGQGMRVRGIAVEDIYNEFNDGIFHPSAIRNFLKVAYTNWTKPAPTYVLLVGDANGDYRDYLGTGKKNIVPVHHSITQGMGLTPDDGWYASVHGNDLLPDMLIGRLSASTPEAAAQVAAKVVSYEKTSDYTPAGALFIADNDESSFEAINEELIAMLPETLSARRVYLSKAESPVSARRAIMNGMNKGMLITNYVGHGHNFYWAAEKIFRSVDIAALENAGKLTFMTSLDCYNNFFSHPVRYSLGELLVITPDKGAIGSFAPSGTGYPWEHNLLGKALFSAVFQDGERVLGSFTTRAKIEAYAQGTSRDLLKCYSLMGDPAARLKTVK